MQGPRRQAARLGAILLAFAVVAAPGCGADVGDATNEDAPDVTKQLPPHMEQMKSEMMKNFQQTAQGKRVLKSGEK